MIKYIFLVCFILLAIGIGLQVNQELYHLNNDTITIKSSNYILDSNSYITATNNNGYIINSAHTYVVINHTYRIKYYCNTDNERIIASAEDTANDIYKCINVNGVCK